MFTPRAFSVAIGAMCTGRCHVLSGTFGFHLKLSPVGTLGVDHAMSRPLTSSKNIKASDCHLSIWGWIPEG